MTLLGCPGDNIQLAVGKGYQESRKAGLYDEERVKVVKVSESLKGEDESPGFRTLVQQ